MAAPVQDGSVRRADKLAKPPSLAKFESHEENRVASQVTQNNGG